MFRVTIFIVLILGVFALASIFVYRDLYRADLSYRPSFIASTSSSDFSFFNNACNAVNRSGSARAKS